jgi:hypothetical protein
MLNPHFDTPIFLCNEWSHYYKFYCVEYILKIKFHATPHNFVFYIKLCDSIFKWKEVQLNLIITLGQNQPIIKDYNNNLLFMANCKPNNKKCHLYQILWCYFKNICFELNNG